MSMLWSRIKASCTGVQSDRQPSAVKKVAMPNKGASKNLLQARRSPIHARRSPTHLAGRNKSPKRRSGSPRNRPKSSPSKSRSSPTDHSSSPQKDVLSSPQSGRDGGSSSPRSSPRRPSPESPRRGGRRLVGPRLAAAFPRSLAHRSTVVDWLKSLSPGGQSPRSGGSPLSRRNAGNNRSPGHRSPSSSGSGSPHARKTSPSQSVRDQASPRMNSGGGIRGHLSKTLVALIVGVVVVGLVSLVATQYLRRTHALTALHCRSETCARYEELLANAMDPDVHPCDNFYAHVCGTWIKAGRKPVYEVNWNHFLVQIAKRTAGLVTRTDTKQEPVDKAVTYIKACLSPLERDNMAEVRGALAAAGFQWPKQDPKPDFLFAVFHMSRRVYHPVFFDIEVAEMDSPLTLMLQFGGQFASTYEKISQHVTTIHAKEHFRASYESLAPMNESHCDELFNQFIDMKRFLDSRTPAADDGNISSDPTFFVRWTPSVQESRWDRLSQRFLNKPLRGLTGAFVDKVGAFKALFALHEAFGEEKMASFVGFFTLQTLVGFSSVRLLESFYAGSDLAVEEQRKVCFTTAYMSYAYAIDSFLLQGSERAMKDVTRLVGWIAEAFGRLLNTTNAEWSPITGSARPEPLPANLNKAFAILNASRREVADRVYAGFPQMAIDAPLANSIAVLAYLESKMSQATGSGQPLYDNYKALDANVFSDFRINPQLLTFPWYEPDAHVGILLGGLGMRLAALSFYDYVERKGASAGRLYAENQKCLLPNATSGTDTDNDLLGAVAAAAVIGNVFGEVSKDADAASPNWEAPPRWTDESMPYVFSCWLYCGDAERGPLMCNTPVMHSRDFGLVFGCPVGSRMNPVDKCRMKV